MAETCKNCTQIISENFCANCGQKKFKRINRKYITDEIQYTVLHTNKGLFYTLKNLIKNPGKTAREYIDGNRIHHYKPLLLVFVLSGISAFFSYKILHLDVITMEGMSNSNLNPAMKNSVNSNFMKEYMATIKTYSSFIMLALVPIFALTTKIAFRKWGNNYYEHVVMNCFILSLYTLITILLYIPFLLVDHETAMLLIKFYMYQILMTPILLFWFFKGFYKNHATKSIILRVFGVFGLVILGFVFISILIAILGFISAMILGPEVMQQYIKPK